MATGRYGSLTPLQQYTQQHQPPQQQQQQQQQHYTHMNFGLQQQPIPPQEQQQIQHPPSNTLPNTLSPGAHVQPQHLQHVNPVPEHVDPSLATLTSASSVPPNGQQTPQSERRKPARQSRKRARSGDDAAPSDLTSSDQAGAAPAPVSVPPPPPQPHPLNKGPYETMEDAMFSLQLHVFTSGYGVSQKRTVKEKLPSGKYDPEGDIIRKDFACDRGGNEFVSQSRGERRRVSRKCGCGWKAAIRRLRREGDRWFIEILDNNHNHPVTSQEEMHTMASYRRWQRENNAGIRTAIERLTKAAAMPARQIALYLKGDVQDPALDRIDKQILRALSIGDKEPPGYKEENDGTNNIMFEMIARRPVILLQGGQPATINGVPTVLAPAANNLPVANSGFGILIPPSHQH